MSWVALGASAISAAGAIGGALLSDDGGGGGGGGAAIQGFDKRNQDQRRIDGAFADFITNNINNFKPGEKFGGQFVAPTSGFENQGFGFLQQFLSQPSSEILPAAKKQVLDTLQGSFDPKTSDQFQALRTQAFQNQDDAIDTVNREVGARNKFFSSERIRELGDVAQNTTNFLNVALAELGNEERNRQVGILNEALSVDADFTKEPLKKVAAALSFGALPRELKQAELEAVYRDFLRIRDEQALPAKLAAGNFSNQGNLSVGNNSLAAQGQSSSGFMEFLGPILQESIPLIINSFAS